MVVKKQDAFTMMEIMVVLMIIGFLMAVLGPRIVKFMAEADVRATKMKINKVKEAMNLYKMHLGYYPKNEEGGLKALLEKPAKLSPAKAQKWRGPYLEDEEDLEDKWGDPLIYNRPPEKHKNYRIFEIISEGGESGEEIYDGV